MDECFLEFFTLEYADFLLALFFPEYFDADLFFFEEVIPVCLLDPFSSAANWSAALKAFANPSVGATFFLSLNGVPAKTWPKTNKTKLKTKTTTNPTDLDITAFS
jgi:hypothetical protein